MLIASNPSSTPEQQRKSLDQLLNQINNTSGLKDTVEAKSSNSSKKSDAEDKPQRPTIYDDNFQQIVLDYFVRVMDGMNDLMDEVKDVVSETRNIKSLLLKRGDAKVMSCKQLAEKHSYVIPLPSIEEFERFDKELEDPQSSLRSDLCMVLPSGLDGGLVMSKCIVKMLKMFITKDVAVQFTAVKQAKGKKIMKNTNLFGCVEAIIKERRSQSNLTTTDKEMTAALSVVMTNAQHWHKRQQADLKRSTPGQPNEQDGSSQGDLLGTYEILHVGDGGATDPLFEVQYLE